MASDHVVGWDCPDRVDAWEDPEISRYSALANAWQQRGRAPSEYGVGDDPSERFSVRCASANAAEDAASLACMTQALTLSRRTRSGTNGCDGREAPGRVIAPLPAKRPIAYSAAVRASSGATAGRRISSHSAEITADISAKAASE